MYNNLFESIFKSLKEDDFDKQQNKNVNTPQQQGDKLKDDGVDSTGAPQSAEEKTEEEAEIEDKKEYLGNKVDDHFYLVTEGGDIVVQDAAGEVVLSAKDKLGQDFQPGTIDSKKAFIKLAVEELKLNVSYDTLEQNDWFEPSEDTELIADQESPSMEPSAVSNPNVTPSTPMPPVPTKPEYKPISKEGGTALDKVEVPPGVSTADEVTSVEQSSRENPVSTPPPVKKPEPKQEKPEMKSKTPNPKFKRKPEMSQESKQNTEEILESLREKYEVGDYEDYFGSSDDQPRQGDIVIFKTGNDKIVSYYNLTIEGGEQQPQRFDSQDQALRVARSIKAKSPGGERVIWFYNPQSAKYSVIECKILEGYKDDRTFRSVVNSLSRNVSRALDGKEGVVTRQDIMNEVDTETKHGLDGRDDASAIRYAIFRKVSRRLNKQQSEPQKPDVSETGDSDNIKIGYEDTLVEEPIAKSDTVSASEDTDQSQNVDSWEYDIKSGKMDLISGGNIISTIDPLTLVKDNVDGNADHIQIDHEDVCIYDSDDNELTTIPVEELISIYQENGIMEGFSNKYIK